MSQRPVVCNAGPLIALSKLHQLSLLAPLYGAVQVPQAVYDEVVTAGLARGATDALAVRLFWDQQGWPIVAVPHDTVQKYLPSVVLDPGEIEVLALAQTLNDPLVLLDDETARSEARRLGMQVRGTLGVLVEAFRRDLLSLAHIELILQEIAVRPDIWISATLCQQILASLQASE